MQRLFFIPMRKLLLLLLVCASISSCAIFDKKKTKDEPFSERSSVKSIALDKVQTNHKKLSYDLGSRVLKTCNTSTFKTFTTQEATQDVIKRMTRDKISLTCHQINRGFGQYNDMQLIEVYHDEVSDSYVYRYKCDYEKKHRIKEMRVTINKDNKVSNIRTLDWKDGFQL